MAAAMNPSNPMTKTTHENPNLPSARPIGSVPEPEVRALRNRVFGRTTSDSNWDSCREYWMQPNDIQWLKDQLSPNSVIKPNPKPKD